MRIPLFLWLVASAAAPLHMVQAAPAEAPAAADLLHVQVLLDRAHHSPGAIDGVMGSNTRRAIRAFQRASGLPVDGQLSLALVEALSAHGAGEPLREAQVEPGTGGPLVDVPAGMEGQAELEYVGYENEAEALAERHHMSPALLRALNPGADFDRAGERIRVVAHGGEGLPAPVARIEVDKNAAELRAYGEDGRLLATYPATVGSANFPSPHGTLEVTAVAEEPTYHFDPKGRDWGPDRKLTIAAGPNNPVGLVWIDLSRDGYGIHGTPEPELIGKTASHGCVRLTNWDAQELGRAVRKGTVVEFV